MKSGIECFDPRVELGLVSEFEEREVCEDSGYRWREWEALDMRERAACIAFQRIKRLTALHANDAATTEYEMRMKREQKRRKGGDE